MGRRSLGSEVQPCCACHCGVSMVCGRLCKTVDTMCQTNGNMMDRTYAYSCTYAEFHCFYCLISCGAVPVACLSTVSNSFNFDEINASTDPRAGTGHTQQCPIKAFRTKVCPVQIYVCKAMRIAAVHCTDTDANAGCEVATPWCQYKITKARRDKHIRWTRCACP